MGPKALFWVNFGLRASYLNTHAVPVTIGVNYAVGKKNDMYEDVLWNVELIPSLAPLRTRKENRTSVEP